MGREGRGRGGRGWLALSRVDKRGYVFLEVQVVSIFSLGGGKLFLIWEVLAKEVRWWKLWRANRSEQI